MAGALRGPHVGLYFSADWCAPCKRFTPKLIAAYNGPLADKGFEVVFVSSDHDEAGFRAAVAGMPWKAIPYSDSSRRDQLTEMFQVTEIPTLVIVDAEGIVVSLDGLGGLEEDPKGERFPWRDVVATALLGTTFVGRNNPSVGPEAVQGKVVGVYFAAAWSEQSVKFTPKLASWYLTVKPRLPTFEIVFVSADKSEGEFRDHLAAMPWVAIPYADEARRKELMTALDVRGSPALVIVDRDGTVLNPKGQFLPHTDPTGAQFPWAPRPVKDLTAERSLFATAVSFLVLLEGATADTHRRVHEALEPLAAESEARAKCKLSVMRGRAISAFGAAPRRPDSPVRSRATSAGPRLQPAHPEADVAFLIGGPRICPETQWVRRHVLQRPLVPKHPHPLEEREAWRCCDACGTSGRLTFHSCVRCEYDLCPDCLGNVVEDGSFPIVALVVDFPNRTYSVAPDLDVTSTDAVRQFLALYSTGAVTRSKFTAE